MKIVFLGPEASFTHLVSSKVFPKEELISSPSILECFKSVRNNLVDIAVLPLENSIEGTVSMTLDYLYDSSDICILAEAVMPISHQLMIHPEQYNDEIIEKIYSHPQALAQTFNFLNKNYPNVYRQEFSSTSAAAKRVSENSHRKLAAVANSFAAKIYGLKIIEKNIQDFEQNHTRFIIISKNKYEIKTNEYPKSTEKTSLLVTLPEDHPGGLHQVLSVFAWRRLNLSKIESRTLKTKLGNYFFFINIEGLVDEILIRNSFEELRSIGVTVKPLGNYPEYLLNK